MSDLGLFQILFWGGALPVSLFFLLHNWLKKKAFVDNDEKTSSGEWDDTDAV